MGLRILVLGGPVFLGRHIADAARARGHEVTIYSRGRHGRAPEGVEHVIGDRADVTPLKARTWDAAIDTSGYEPHQLEASTGLDVGHYVFVSTCNVYPDWPEKPVDEDSPTWEAGDGYGELKAACERVGFARGRFATVRAGLLVGPHDNIFRLPWWVRRITDGGRVPAPGDPERELQIIDARDLASFLVHLAEERIEGAFNGTAPIGQTTFGGRLGEADFVWIPYEKLEAAAVEPWVEPPLWLPARYEGTWRIGTGKAQQ